MDEQHFPPLLRAPFIDSDAPIRRLDIASTGENTFRRVRKTVPLVTRKRANAA